MTNLSTSPNTRSFPVKDTERNSHLGNASRAKHCHSDNKLDKQIILLFAFASLGYIRRRKCRQLAVHCRYFQARPCQPCLHIRSSSSSAGNSIFTWPEGIRISFIVYPVILTKTKPDYVIWRGTRKPAVGSLLSLPWCNFSVIGLVLHSVQRRPTIPCK